MFYKIIYIFPSSTQSKQTSYSCVKETSLLVEVDLHMGGFVEQTFQGFSLMAGESSIDDFRSNRRVMVCDDDEDDPSDSISFSEDSSTSIASTSSDFTDDASSSASHPSSLPSSSPPSSPQQTSSGPLYELSELMAHLPIKRGLSRHYDGKSQSFTSLSNVRCIEDLAKKESPYSKKMKSCKSYGGLLDYHKSYSPGACTRTISKKASRGSFSCLLSKKSSSASSRPPIPIQKTL